MGAPHGPRTESLVERNLRVHAYPAFGDLPLKSIMRFHIERWVKQLPLAPSSARVVLGYVSQVFRAAVQSKLVAANPCEGVAAPRLRKKEVWIPERAAVDVVIDILPGHLRAVAELAVGSGLWQAELVGLEVHHLDFLRDRSVAVEQQLVKLPGREVYLGPVKTEASRRIVPLARRTLDALAAHLAAYPPVEVEIEDRTDPRHPVRRLVRLVFSGDGGLPITGSMWTKAFHPAAQAAGFPAQAGVHTLRHYFASSLIRYGGSIKTVQKVMGHSTAEQTLNTYAHMWPDAAECTRAAVESAGADVALVSPQTEAQ